MPTIPRPASDAPPPAPDATDETTPPSWTDGKRYAWLLGLLVPLLPFIAWGLVELSGVGVLWFFEPLLVFGVFPLGRVLARGDADVMAAVVLDEEVPVAALGERDPAQPALEARALVAELVRGVDRDAADHRDGEREADAVEHRQPAARPQPACEFARRVMDHRVLEHYGGQVGRANVHGRRRARARYGLAG